MSRHSTTYSQRQTGFFKNFYRRHPTLTKALAITAPMVAVAGWLVSACTPQENHQTGLIGSTESGNAAMASAAQQAGDLIIGACSLLQSIGILGVALRPGKHTLHHPTEKDKKAIFLESSETSKTNLTPVHEKQLDAIRDFLELKDSIVASAAAKGVYEANTQYKFLKDRKLLIHKFIKEAKVNKAFRCKLWKMIQTKRPLKIEICLPQEPTLLSEKNMARYDGKRTSILMPIDRIRSSDDISSLVHEVHHVDIEDSNEKMDRRIWQIGSDKLVVSTHPCNSNPENYIDCTELKTIIEKGRTNAKRLLSLLNKKADTLSKKEKRELETYHRLRQGYEPLTLELPQNKDDINNLKQRGIIDDQLRFKQDAVDRSAGFEATLGPLVERRGRHFLQVHSCFKSSNAKACDNPNDSQRPLQDLLLLISNVEKTQWDPSSLISEQDAAANQVLERYPELFDFIIPGLRSYHEERNTELYRQCLAS